jgi:RNA polymerase sigma factor (sigma-70 family)
LTIAPISRITVYMLNINAMVTPALLKKLSASVVRAVGDTGATDDIVQDALVRILSNADAFDAEKGAFDSWACRIASNVARNWRKASANRGHDSEDTSDEGETSALVDTIGPDAGRNGFFVGPDGRADVERTADAQALIRALDRLEDDERAFIMAINDGMSQTDAGKAVGWSPATATRRRKALAERLAKSL